MKFFKVLLGAGLVLVLSVGIAGSPSGSSVASADSSDRTVLAPLLDSQSMETLREELFLEHSVRFDEEVEAIVSQLVDERESAGLKNELLEELEASIADTEMVVDFYISNIHFMSLDSYKEMLAKSFDVQLERLDEHVSAWKDELEAEVEREAERERVRLEKEAEEARVLAEQQQQSEAVYYETSNNGWSSGAGSSQPSNAGPSYNYTIYVAGYGGQGLIDACAGAVWWEGAGNLLAEHWHCGGASVPQWAGAIINIPGYGIYQSSGVVGVVDQAVSNVSHIPGGYSIVYQTCLNGNPGTTGFIGLTKIG